MPDAQPPRAPDQPNPLRVCPDCGGILELTEPTWTTAIDIAADTRRHITTPQQWRCLICGYRD